MIGYKGFDKDFCCRGFQYKVGEIYHFDGELNICESGFHFCDTPLAVWHFYPPNNNRFALVEASGNIIDGENDKHKFCTDTLYIVKELSMDELIKIAEKEYAKNQKSNTGYGSVATNTGDCSAATNTGDRSAATNTGDRSAATNTGDYSAATNTGNDSAATVSGKNSIAIVIGANSKARGALGCWLVLSEWKDSDLLTVKAFKVDGKLIKPDTFYTLKGGEAVIAEQSEN